MPDGFYDRSGKEITLMEWCELKARGEAYIRIAESTEGPVWISTVWLGFDYSFEGGPPLIFETMTFPRRGVAWPLSLDPLRRQRRYCTEAAAREGHEQIVREVKETLKGETE